MFRQNIARSLYRHQTSPSSCLYAAATIKNSAGGPTRTRPLSSTTTIPLHPLRIRPSSPSFPLRPHHRSLGTSGPFSPVHGPPPPSSLGAPKPARAFRRTTKWTRRILILVAAGGTLYLIDRQVSSSGLARSLRTFYTGLRVALDYKINFRAHPLPLIGSEGGIEELHRRSAERMFDLLRHNGGLYLKIGQAIAMQSAVLPPEFQKMFSRMFDDAPQRSWEEVEKVIREDFGMGVQEVFGVSWAGAEGKGVMERTARASASVAQVHWARLADGREVAVKIQKPEIKKQIGWDLWAFK